MLKSAICGDGIREQEEVQKVNANMYADEFIGLVDLDGMMERHVVSHRC